MRGSFIRKIALVFIITSATATSWKTTGGTSSKFTKGERSLDSTVSVLPNAYNTDYVSDYRATNFVSETNYWLPTRSVAGLTSLPALNQSTTGNAATITGNIVKSQVMNLATYLKSKGNSSNKQNLLTLDGTCVKFPTVDAVNTLKLIKSDESLFLAQRKGDVL